MTDFRSRVFKHDVRIYYEDTDMGGIVYYANYLKFMERGRTEMLRERGFDQRRLKDDDHIIFVVRHVEADYRKAAVFDDLLVVETQITEIKRASMRMRQDITRNGVVIFSGVVALVAVDPRAMKAVRIPEHIIAKLVG